MKPKQPPFKYISTPVSTNVDKGYLTHGKFKNKGQKPGRKAVAKDAKEKQSDTVNSKLKKVTKNLMYHMDTNPMHAQFNA